MVEISPLVHPVGKTTFANFVKYEVHQKMFGTRELETLQEEVQKEVNKYEEVSGKGFKFGPREHGWSVRKDENEHFDTAIIVFEKIIGNFCGLIPE